MTNFNMTVTDSKLSVGPALVKSTRRYVVPGKMLHDHHISDLSLPYDEN